MPFLVAPGCSYQSQKCQPGHLAPWDGSYTRVPEHGTCHRAGLGLPGPESKIHPDISRPCRELAAKHSAASITPQFNGSLCDCCPWY